MVRRSGLDQFSVFMFYFENLAPIWTSLRETSFLLAFSYGSSCISAAVGVALFLHVAALCLHMWCHVLYPKVLTYTFTSVWEGGCYHWSILEAHPTQPLTLVFRTHRRLESNWLAITEKWDGRSWEEADLCNCPLGVGMHTVIIKHLDRWDSDVYISFSLLSVDAAHWLVLSKHW